MRQSAHWSGDTGNAGDTRARILEMARLEVIQEGWAAATSGRVARRAGVSKALIHYHFRDKDALLGAVAVQCREHVMGRGLQQEPPRVHANPVDSFGEWLESELAAGDLRVALQLRGSGNVEVVRAADTVLTVVHAEIERQVDRVFVVLDLVPSIPSEAMVDVFMTIAEGAALVPVEPATRLRRLLETVWLSLLSVGE